MSVQHFTREELLHRLTINFRDEARKRAFLDDPFVSLALTICDVAGCQPQECLDNAEAGFAYLQGRGERDASIAVGFMVIHEYWNIRVIEHSWLVVRDEDGEHIVDPSLPFLLVTRLPSYFQGAVKHPGDGFPTLRNKRYKEALTQAKHLAETCEYPYMETAKRHVHIGRARWLRDAAEGRAAR